METVNLFRFGAFYNNMDGYPSNAMEAATAVADRAEKEDDGKYGKRNLVE